MTQSSGHVSRPSPGACAGDRKTAAVRQEQKVGRAEPERLPGGCGSMGGGVGGRLKLALRPKGAL